MGLFSVIGGVVGSVVPGVGTALGGAIGGGLDAVTSKKGKKNKGAVASQQPSAPSLMRAPELRRTERIKEFDQIMKANAYTGSDPFAIQEVTRSWFNRD